jgi:hypothetical protein
MSSIQIPNLPAATGLNGTEQLEGVQSGTSVKITTSQIASYISGAYPAPGIATITGTAPVNASTVGDAVTISLNSQGITNSFLAPMAAGTVKANVTVGSASPTDPTVSQVLDVIGSAKGNILYRDTSSWAALTGGTNGQVLTAQGTTAAPIWATLSVPSGQIAPTGVVAGTYGSASTSPQYTVLASGQLSAASNVPIVIPYTSVTGLGSMATQNASAVAITGGTIDGTTIGGTTPAPATFTTLTSTGATNLGTISTGVWQGTPVAVAYGGTGATTAAGARSNLGAAASGANSDITSLSGLTTPLSAPQGGTGFGSYTTGDILYADTSSTLARLNDVATGNALISGGVGVAPSYGKIGLTTHVSGTLPVANGGTGATTLTGYVYGNGTGAFTAAATIPNAGLTNSSVTIGSTSISLGGTATTLAGLTTVTLTQDPTSALEASTKQYVDDQVATVSNTTFHASSEYATTADLGTVTYSNGTGGVNATITQSGSPSVLVIDGYTFTASDVTNATRVLVKNQTSGLQNGIYTVTNQGSGAANWQLTRATDFDTVGTGPSRIETGASTFVTGGSVNASTGWVMNTTGTITVGSTALVWVQTSSSSSVTVTSPLTKVGSVISLGTVPTTFGGTGLTTLTQYNVMLGNGTGNVAFAAPGTTGYPLLSTGASSNPAFGQLSLTAGVTGTLPVANGGTGTSTAFTTGALVFAGASGTYSQNATELFWDNTNTFLGIGTNTPRAELTVVADTQTFVPATASLPAGTEIYVVGADSANTRITQDAFGTGNYVAFTGRQARGTAASPTATQANDPISLFTGRGYGTTAWSSNSVGYLGIYAAENFTDTAQGSYIDLETTNLGTSSVTRKFRVGSEGQWGIHSGGSPDYGTSGYVFTSGGASARPTWSQVSASSLTGVLPVANGGTNISSYTIGDLLYADGITSLAKLADIATGNVLLSGGVGAAPSYGKVGLTTHVTGTLPIANGGTALTSTPTNGQLLIGNGTGYSLGTLTASTGISVTNGSGSITIANTGVTSLTAGTNITVSASTGGVTISTTTTPTWTSETVPLISGGTTASSTLTLQSTSGAGTSDAIIFKTGSQVERMRIDTSGNVGIGSAPIGIKLSVASSGLISYFNSSTTDGYIRVDETGGTNNIFGGTNGVGFVGTSTNYPFTIRTNNTERMRIDSSGSVGIGITTLAAKLSITTASTTAYGLISQTPVVGLTTGNYVNMAYFANTRGTNNDGLRIVNVRDSTGSGVGNWETESYRIRRSVDQNDGSSGVQEEIVFGANLLAFNTAGSERMRIDSSGNVGIGTTSPGAKLGLTTTAASAGWQVRVNNNGVSNDTGIYADASNNMEFAARNGSGTLTVRIGSSGDSYINAGNVGIGTSSPTQKLDVYGGAGAAVSLVRAASGQNAFFSVIGNGNSFLSTSFDMVQDSSSVASLVQRANGPLYFSTNNTERMRVDASGNVGINQTTPASYGKLCVFTENADATDLIYLQRKLSGTFRIKSPSGGLVSMGTPLGDNLAVETNGTERARFSTGFSVGTTADPGVGAIYATGNITAYYSDDRLKVRKGNIENALAKVEAISGFHYEANETAQALGYKAKPEVGVSAQEVQAILPEVVVPAPVDDQYLTVHYERLVPLLIEAVKELSGEVKALNARAKELEAK